LARVRQTTNEQYISAIPTSFRSIHSGPYGQEWDDQTDGRKRHAIIIRLPRNHETSTRV